MMMGILIGLDGIDRMLGLSMSGLIMDSSDRSSDGFAEGKSCACPLDAKHHTVSTMTNPISLEQVIFQLLQCFRVCEVNHWPLG